jgi:16S rRNA C1402 N4-methylase RsmH
MKLIDKINAYIRANDIEKSAKEREQQIKTVVNLILKERTAKQAIQVFNNIKIELNKELLKVLKQSNEDIESITTWVNEEIN